MMNPVINRRSVEPDVLITISSGVHPISDEINSVVEEIWSTDIRDAGSKLYNGTLYSVVSISLEQIIVREAQFMHFYAQLQAPSLFESLKIRPLACNGVLQCPDGLVFARRSNSVTLDQECWEFAPSGTFDDACKIDDTTLDPKALFHMECNEELGIPRTCLDVGGVLAVLENEHTRAFDLILDAKTSLLRADIENAFRNRKTEEYTELRIIENKDTEKFVQQHRRRFASTTLNILDLLRPSN